MNTHVTSSNAIKPAATASLTGLAILGIAGVIAGGPVWGLLGVAAVLFSVVAACHTIQYEAGTQEIERVYALAPAVPAHKPRLRTLPVKASRAYILTPLSEFESAN